MAGTTPPSGNIFSRLSGALTGPQMAPWWALALGGTRQQQASGFQQGLQGIQQAQQHQQAFDYQKEQDAVANSMAQQKFQAQMAQMEAERQARQQNRALEDQAIKAIAQQQNMSEEQARLAFSFLDEKQRAKAMGFTQFADPMKPFSPAGQEQADIQGGRLDPDFLEQRRAGSRQSVTVNNMAGKEVPPKVWDVINEGHEKASSALRDTQVIGQLEGLIDEGIRTGSLQQSRQEAARLAATIGMPVNEDLINNTDAFAAQAGKRVAEIITAFGAGTGLSDADRQYAERIAGGDLRVDPAGLKKLFAMAKQANMTRIDDYRRRVEPLLSQPGFEHLAPIYSLPDIESATQPQQGGVQSYRDYF